MSSLRRRHEASKEVKERFHWRDAKVLALVVGERRSEKLGGFVNCTWDHVSSFPLRFNSLGLQTKLIETQRKGGAEEKSTEVYLTALGEGHLVFGVG